MCARRLIRLSTQLRRQVASTSERSSLTYQQVWLSGLTRTRCRVGWPRTVRCRWSTAAGWRQTWPGEDSDEEPTAVMKTANCSVPAAASTRSALQVRAYKMSMRRRGGLHLVEPAAALRARQPEEQLREEFCIRHPAQQRASRRPRSLRPSSDRPRWKPKDHSDRPGCRQPSLCLMAFPLGCLRRPHLLTPAGDSARLVASVLCSKARRRSSGWCQQQRRVLAARDWPVCRNGCCFSIITNNISSCSTWQRWDSSSSSAGWLRVSPAVISLSRRLWSTLDRRRRITARQCVSPSSSSYRSFSSPCRLSRLTILWRHTMSACFRPRLASPALLPVWITPWSMTVYARPWWTASTGASMRRSRDMPPAVFSSFYWLTNITSMLIVKSVAAPCRRFQPASQSPDTSPRTVSAIFQLLTRIPIILFR